jgi:hypothetical protein
MEIMQSSMHACISASMPLGPQVQLDASGLLIFRMGTETSCGNWPSANARPAQASAYSWQAVLPDATRICCKHNGDCIVFLPDGSTCEHHRHTAGGLDGGEARWVATLPSGERHQSVGNRSAHSDNPSRPSVRTEAGGAEQQEASISAEPVCLHVSVILQALMRQMSSTLCAHTRACRPFLWSVLQTWHTIGHMPLK